MYRFAFLILIAGAMPALAQSSIQVAEPGDAALFVAGVVGLIVSRRWSRRPPPRDDA